MVVLPRIMDVGEVLPVGDDAVEAGEGEDVLEAEEDVEPLRVLPTPILPSYAEMENIELITGLRVRGATNAARASDMSDLISGSPRVLRDAL